MPTYAVHQQKRAPSYVKASRVTILFVHSNRHAMEVFTFTLLIRCFSSFVQSTLSQTTGRLDSNLSKNGQMPEVNLLAITKSVIT